MRICGISTAFVAVAWGWLAFAQAAQERPPDKGDGALRALDGAALDRRWVTWYGGDRRADAYPAGRVILRHGGAVQGYSAEEGRATLEEVT